MEYALDMLIPIVLGIAGGLWLDKKLHLTPLFTILGMVLGMAVGLWGMYKKTVSKK